MNRSADSIMKFADKFGVLLYNFRLFNITNLNQI
ncbi:hypothetical protein UFOVP1230_28 [uncultured Caudovirales phage]|uniref:Uncharacterized protein n=1 Tax=uncultured Caudovirales phage TaxID=2100421 RepID=A0A6J5R7W1_9CAUD|nr:hypothetical protein UFOVP1230_28 [uncultured Caudovirales phage]